MGRFSQRGVAIVGALGLLAACSSDTAPRITLVEFAIAAPASLPAGYNELEVVATGVAHHSISICPADTVDVCDDERIDFDLLRKPDARDQSLYRDRDSVLVLGAGWDARVGVDLAPGTYRMWCSIVNHAASGMQSLITAE